MRDNSPFAKVAAGLFPQAVNTAVQVDASTLRVTRFSPASGMNLTRDMPITAEQWAAYQGGAFVQDVLAHLSEGDREWILSGMTSEEFDAMFKDDDDA